MPFNADEHRRKLRNLIHQEFSASLMSTTRWIKTFEVLHGLPLSCRLKLITADQPGPWSIPPSFGPAPFLPAGWIEGCGYSPLMLLEVKWVEVTPRWRTYRAERETDPDEHVQKIEEKLRRVGAPFTWTGSVIRIWGHQRMTNPVEQTSSE